MRWGLAACTLVIAAPAFAQRADELQAQGEDAARSGDYANAIDKFKAADRVAPTAQHVCLIALAYTRRNLWPQAEVFRTLCHERATKDDPLPPWMDEADKQIDEAIAKADVAAVTIVTTPSNARAKLTVSSFAQDESFAPRTIHLPPGRHEIFASAPGYNDARVLVVVEDRKPRTVAIELHPWGVVDEAPRVVERPRSRVPWLIVGGGVAIGAAGALLEATWYLDAVRKVQGDTAGQSAVASDLATWRTRRDVVITCYGVGAAAIVAGIALRYTVFEHARGTPRIGFAPTRGGAAFALEWQR